MSPTDFQYNRKDPNITVTPLKNANDRVQFDHNPMPQYEDNLVKDEIKAKSNKRKLRPLSSDAGLIRPSTAQKQVFAHITRGLTEVLQEFELLGEGNENKADLFNQQEGAERFIREQRTKKGGRFFNFEDFLTEDA